MAVYWVTGIVALFYLAALPIRAGAAWRSGENLRLGVSVGAFRVLVQISLKHIPEKGWVITLVRQGKERIHEFNLSNLRPKQARQPKQTFSSPRALKYLLGHIHPYRLNIALHFSQGDAAQNAFLYGICRIALSTWHTICPSLPLTASVRADFRAEGTRANLSGILQCRLGHIMIAGLMILRDFLLRRFHTWTTNNPSKAS